MHRIKDEVEYADSANNQSTHSRLFFFFLNGILPAGKDVSMITVNSKSLIFLDSVTLLPQI